MAYSKQTWANDDPTTPIDADRLAHIEVGIEAAASAADAAATAKVAKAGDSMSGDLAMGGHRVTGLADPAAAQDAATRAYVLAQIAALINSAPGILDTLGELAAALQADESAAATLTALVGTKAPLASPALTGAPTVNGATVEDRTHAAATYAPVSATWQANTNYKAGELVTNGGVLYSANADFTSGVSFNGANWTVVGGGGFTATVDGTPAASLAITTGVAAPDIGAAYASIAWQANTNYKANQLVLQGGAFYYANADFTSGSVFNAANWTQVVSASPVYLPAPADFGLGAWSGLPKDHGTGAAPSAAGVLQLVKIKVPVAITVTNLLVSVSAQGNTLANCFAGLYDSTGALLGATADQSASWASGAAVKTMALAGGPVALAAGSPVYVALLVGSATTLPQFYKGPAGNQAQVNAGKTGAGAFYGSILTGRTSLPSSFTPASVAAGFNTFWVATS